LVTLVNVMHPIGAAVDAVADAPVDARDEERRPSLVHLCVAVGTLRHCPRYRSLGRDESVTTERRPDVGIVMPLGVTLIQVLGGQVSPATQGSAGGAAASVRPAPASSRGAVPEEGPEDSPDEVPDDVPEDVPEEEPVAAECTPAGVLLPHPPTAPPTRKTVQRVMSQPRGPAACALAR
jgi:hypothetical protein